MAFEMIDLYRLYTCISTDIKKTDNIENGSILKETDTGFEYIFNGTSWVYNPVSVQISNGANNADVIKCDGCYGLVTMTPAHISTNNSFKGTLTSGTSFTGTAEEITNFGVISVICGVSIDLATDGFKIEFSTDGTTWIDGDLYSIYAGEAKVFSFQCSAKYYRIIVTNGVVGANDIDLQVVLKPYYVKPSSHRIGDIISAEDDAELMKSVLTAKDVATNLFVPINATPTGSLKTANVEDGLSIAKGEVTNTFSENKFGHSPDFDFTDGYIDLWEGANDAGINQMQYTYSTSAIIDSLSSSNNADTQLIEIIGLDANYDLIFQTKTATGQTRVALDTPLVRVFRLKNRGTTNIAGQLYCYENTAIVAGVPTDKTKIKALINDGKNQTLMALYTIPAGFTGYMREWFASVAGVKKTAEYGIELYARPFGEVFQIKGKTGISDTATSNMSKEYTEPLVFTEKTDIALKVACLTSTTTNCSLSGGFSLVIIKNI